MRSLWLGFAVAIACSGNAGSDGRSPAAPATQGGSGGTGGTSSRGGAGQKPEAGSPADAGAAGASEAHGGAGIAGDGGAGEVFETAGAPPQAPPGICEPSLMLGADVVQRVGIPGAMLLAMTADELSVAFSTSSGGGPALHVADRLSAQADFTETILAMPDGYEAESGVSFSSDGLELILVKADHSGFGSVSRSRRGDAFGIDVDATAFAKINLLKPMSGRSVGWPVLSSDGQSLYFLSYLAQGLVVQSRRGRDGVFDFGTEIDPFTLGGQVGQYKLPSGLSTDERAIFFFDQATQHSMALFRSRPGAPFYDPLDLGDRRGATPNEDCSRLYSSVAGGVVLQPRK